MYKIGQTWTWTLPDGVKYTFLIKDIFDTEEWNILLLQITNWEQKNKYSYIEEYLIDNSIQFDKLTKFNKNWNSYIIKYKEFWSAIQLKWWKIHIYPLDSKNQIIYEDEHEMTMPESQNILDSINKEFWTKFLLTDFNN